MSDPDKATCKYENIDYLKTALPEWLSEEKRVVNLMKALERASSIQHNVSATACMDTIMLHYKFIIIATLKNSMVTRPDNPAFG